MKKHLKSLLALLVLTGIFACEKDEIEPPQPPSGTAPVMAQFGPDERIAENAGPQTIQVKFSKEAPREGVVKIDVDAGFPASFQTAPAVENGVLEIGVPKGARAVSFTLTPVDNDVLGEDQVITFDLASVSEGFEIGAKRMLTVIIQDDELPAGHVMAEFAATSGSLNRDQAEGMEVMINFSGPAPAGGQVIIALNGATHEERFSTEPAMNNNGRLTLNVPAGATSAGFTVWPVAGADWFGDKTTTLMIAATEGGINMGNVRSYALSLPGVVPMGVRPKSYESIGGGWRFKETYEYDDAGRILQKNWEKETPMFSQGTTTYHYTDNDLIEKVVYYPGREEIFIQENGRIVRSETISNNIKISYSDYEYNVFGRLSTQTEYHRQASGEYLLGFKYVYEYENNGNITQQLTYEKQAGSAEFVLRSTRTYNYFSFYNHNPFPMIEVIPGVVMQKHLPGSFRIKENGVDLLYAISYDLSEATSLPVRRIISGGGTTEVTTYEYYPD